MTDWDRIEGGTEKRRAQTAQEKVLKQCQRYWIRGVCAADTHFLPQARWRDWILLLLHLFFSSPTLRSVKDMKQMEGFRVGRNPLSKQESASMHDVERGKSAIRSGCGQQVHVGSWFVWRLDIREGKRMAFVFSQYWVSKYFGRACCAGRLFFQAAGVTTEEWEIKGKETMS